MLCRAGREAGGAGLAVPGLCWESCPHPTLRAQRALSGEGRGSPRAAKGRIRKSGSERPSLAQDRRIIHFQSSSATDPTWIQCFANRLKLDLWCCQHLLSVGQPTNTKKEPNHHRGGITNEQESHSEQPAAQTQINKQQQHWMDAHTRTPGCFQPQLNAKRTLPRQLRYDQNPSLAEVHVSPAEYGLIWQCWLEWFCRMVSLEPERPWVPVPNTLIHGASCRCDCHNLGHVGVAWLSKHCFKLLFCSHVTAPGTWRGGEGVCE